MRKMQKLKSSSGTEKNTEGVDVERKVSLEREMQVKQRKKMNLHR